MHEIRRRRLESVIHTELAQWFTREARDPRLAGLIITSVTMATGAQMVTITYHASKPCMEVLRSIRGMLRSFVAKALKTRYVPELFFEEDKGLDNMMRVHELLQETRA